MIKENGRKRMDTLRIGTVVLDNPLILAPMAGVTDLPFRLLCREQGAGLLCMEMVSAKAIYYRNKHTEKLLEIDSREHPVSLQLFGSDADILAEIAAQIEERRVNSAIRSLGRFFAGCFRSACYSSQSLHTPLFSDKRVPTAAALPYRRLPHWKIICTTETSPTIGR